MPIISFKQFLLEKAPLAFTSPAASLVKFIISKLPFQEIGSYRGKYFDESGIYQLRFKPNAPSPTDVDDLLAFLRSKEAKSIGITKVGDVSPSQNSGKYKGIPFTYMNMPYEAIIGSGQNQGEKFEKEVLKSIQDYLDGDYNELANKVLTALDKLDLDDFSVDDIKEAKARTGSTHRASATPEEMGKIIADIILVMDDGSEIYLSVKNEIGTTVGQLGLANTFSQDYSIDTTSAQYKQLIKPLHLSAKKIKDGFIAYENGETLKGQTVTSSDAEEEELATLLKGFFGVGYIYLREKGDKFIATEIDHDFLDNKLFNGLKITEIRYPEPGRKQISIFLNSNSTKFKLEIRNAKGGIVPAQIQLQILSTTLDEMK